MPSQAVRVPFGPIIGLDERHFPPAGSLAQAINVRVDDQGAWAQCRGVTELYKYGQSSPLANTGEIETMTWFGQHQGGRQWLIWENRTTPSSAVVDLVAFSGSQRSFNVVSASRRFHAGPWLKTRYLAHNDWLYYVNGYDAPERWNGRWKTRIGFDRAAAAPIPFSNESILPQDWMYPNWLYESTSTYAGSPLTAEMLNGLPRRGMGPQPVNGNSGTAALTRTFYTYGYALTYINDLNQESPVSPIRLITGTAIGVDSAVAPPVNNDTGLRGFCVQLPAPPAHAVGMRLWRTQNVYGLDPSTQVQANLYLHTEFACAIDGVIADLKSDDELGRILDRSNLGPLPNSVRMLSMFRGRMFAAVATGNTSTLQYSANGFIEQFPVDNILPIGDTDSGHITAMYATKDALVVMKERGIYLVRQQIDGFFRAETLTEDSGCSAPGCVVEIPGQGLLLVSTAGIRLLSGALANEGVPTRVEDNFDERVRDTFHTRVSVGSLITAFAVVNHQDREVWIQLPQNGQVRPTFGLVYHYAANAWSIREGWSVSCGIETHDHRAVVYFGSNAVDAAGIYQVYQYTNGVEVTTAPVMKAAPMTRRGAQMIWTAADLYTVTFGSGRSLAMSVYINRRVRPETDNAESRTLVDTESEDIPGQWGSAVWDAGYWGDHIVQPVRYSVQPPGSPTDVQWSITGTRFAVFGLDLDLTLNQMHKIDSSVSAAWTG